MSCLLPLAVAVGQGHSCMRAAAHPPPAPGPSPSLPPPCRRRFRFLHLRDLSGFRVGVFPWSSAQAELQVGPPTCRREARRSLLAAGRAATPPAAPALPPPPQVDSRSVHHKFIQHLCMYPDLLGLRADCPVVVLDRYLAVEEWAHFNGQGSPSPEVRPLPRRSASARLSPAAGRSAAGRPCRRRRPLPHPAPARLAPQEFAAIARSLITTLSRAAGKADPEDEHAAIRANFPRQDPRKGERRRGGSGGRRRGARAAPSPPPPPHPLPASPAPPHPLPQGRR